MFDRNWDVIFQGVGRGNRWDPKRHGPKSTVTEGTALALATKAPHWERSLLQKAPRQPLNLHLCGIDGAQWHSMICMYQLCKVGQGALVVKRVTHSHRARINPLVSAEIRSSFERALFTRTIRRAVTALLARTHVDEIPNATALCCRLAQIPMTLPGQNTSNNHSGVWRPRKQHHTV